MEIDFSETNLNVALLLSVVAVILGLLLLGALGRFVLPDRVLTWSEWQLLNQHAAYRREVLILQRECDRLTKMVNQDKVDPIRAQIAVEQIVRNLADVTLSPLGMPRQALLDTSQAFLGWSLGHPKQPLIVAQQQANILTFEASR